MTPTSIEPGEAYLSEDRIYRYALKRVWAAGPMMFFVGLNPSTADEHRLDPTMRRVIGFARREGYGGVWMGNLFAFRATSPENMKAASAPIGPDNDSWLVEMAHWCGTGNVVAGWGAHGSFLDRDAHVRTLLDGYGVRCLGLTKAGHPRHPLYLGRETPLTPFEVGR